VFLRAIVFLFSVIRFDNRHRVFFRTIKILNYLTGAGKKRIAANLRAAFPVAKKKKSPA
jgi:hypothetical protein